MQLDKRFSLTDGIDTHYALGLKQTCTGAATQQTHWTFMNTTLDYYNQHAQAFAAATQAVDMQALYQPFLRQLPARAAILDAGCGSGRDALYFHQQGHDVAAFDYALELVQTARAHTGLDVWHMGFEALALQQRFDGVWACASLLHCEPAHLLANVQRLLQALKPNGVLYMSFKYGAGVREHEGRVFTDMNEHSMAALLAALPESVLLEQWFSADQRPEKSAQWLNVLLRQQG